MMAHDRMASSDAGSITVWTVGVIVGCMAVVGLVLDGGTVLRARSTAYDIAGAAARAGAQELDQVELTSGRVVLDAAAVRNTVAAYLSAHDAEGDVTIDGLTVTVTVRRTVDLQILKPASLTVDEAATVRAHEGRP